MKNYKENATSRSGDLKRIFSSCPRHKATNASRLAAAALAKSEKTKSETADLHQTLVDVHNKVSNATDAVDGLRGAGVTEDQQSKIRLYTAYIEELKVRVRTLALEIKDLKSLRDSLHNMAPCA